MTSMDFLNYSLGLGFLILIGFASYALYNLSLTLKESTSILTKVDEITKDVNDVKNLIKHGISYLMSMFSNKDNRSSKTISKKGGDINGK